MQLKEIIKTSIFLIIMCAFTEGLMAAEIAKGNKGGEISLLTSVIDRTITYQGILKSSSGTPVPNGAYNLTFRIFEQSSGGSALWTSGAIPVTTSNGLFSTLIGPISLPFDTTYYISVQVQGDAEMSRQRMTMSPYSASSDTANYVRYGISDCNWSFRIQDTADTSLAFKETWGLTRNGNIAIGNADSTHVNFGIQCTTGTAENNYKYCTVGGGHFNNASGFGSTVGGGEYNAARIGNSTVAGGLGNNANGNAATVGGGQLNNAIGLATTVAGGIGNTVDGNSSTIAGGYANQANNVYSFIGGGYLNKAYRYGSTVCGGYNNTANGEGAVVGGGLIDTAWGMYSGVASGNHNLAGNAFEDTGAFVGGGKGNSATDLYSIVGGGRGNSASASWAVVVGGQINGASGTYATIVGGGDNLASGYASTIGGGQGHRVSGTNATVGGGRLDSAIAVYSGVASGYSNLAGDAVEDTGAFVGGGYDNSATGKHTTVGGGYSNTASGSNATISGGWGNTAIGGNAAISGGYSNTAWYTAAIGGGGGNTASGDYAAIVGGLENENGGSYSAILGGLYDTLTGSADYSIAFGRSVYLNNAYRVALFDTVYDGRLGVNRDDRSGGILYPIHVGGNTSNGNGAYLTTGGVWTNGSSRTFKENFTPIEGNLLLSKIAGLSITSWNYKNTTEKHIGPVAEDFTEAFDTGVIREDNGKRENQYLAAGDVAGVALAGVQELMKIIEAQNKKIEELQGQISELKNR
jgi:hypothetical protein